MAFATPDLYSTGYPNHPLPEEAMNEQAGAVEICAAYCVVSVPLDCGIQIGTYLLQRAVFRRIRTARCDERLHGLGRSVIATNLSAWRDVTVPDGLSTVAMARDEAQQWPMWKANYSANFLSLERLVRMSRQVHLDPVSRPDEHRSSFRRAVTLCQAQYQASRPHRVMLVLVCTLHVDRSIAVD